ncbi:MAG: amidinotransferase, partial [Candidatus Bathyarchaeota archaeon]|nr:amidinotransferase [Candidatus Bathyarchaeota archaeon]
MVKNEGDNLKKVVVCSPKSEYFKVKDLTTHNFITYPEPNQAKREHDRLRSILKGFGSEVIDIPELPGHPNSVFTRDTS